MPDPVVELKYAIGERLDNFHVELDSHKESHTRDLEYIESYLKNLNDRVKEIEDRLGIVE